MSFDEAAGYERRGADVGLNPMFGDWQQHFRITPIPYGAGARKREELRASVQALLNNQFYFNGNVRLGITLYLDVQSVLEESDQADLDNYAKAILDALKGPDGILLDDTQVQTLTISWINKFSASPSFEVEVQASPDDFILKPVSFYEMPDQLWWPVSQKAWEQGAAEALSDRDHFIGLLLREVVSGAKRSVRHELRKIGANRLQAYQRALWVGAAPDRGFHKSRLDDGFEKKPLKVWRAEFKEWKQNHPEYAAQIEEIIANIRKNYEGMSLLTLGKLPPNDQTPEPPA